MTVFTVTSGVRIVTDNIYLLPPDATAHRVIRACHTCKHHRRSESDHRSCDATGEDLEFSRRLRRLGSAVLLDPPLWSSPRRFRRQGNWRTTLFNMAFIGLFYLGIDPCTLHRWYYGRLRGSPVHGIGVDPVSRG